VAHVDVPDEFALKCESWIAALNVRLPASIRVLAVKPVAAEFHARFDAKAKVYEYRIWRGRVMSPFEAGLAWHVWGAVDMGALREGAALLCGAHNFARLSANRGDLSEVERRAKGDGLVRTIHRIDVLDEADVLRLMFEGDGFMYKMVRLMAGSMIHVARGRASLGWLRGLIDDPSGEKSNHCAPADGLYLVHVGYGDGR
jgi:tRNA pseudouridine38-40 synthase